MSASELSDKEFSDKLAKYCVDNENNARSAPSERSSKPKKRKLPGQPKKPMTAYFLWMNEEGRDDIKKENPGMTITEVAKVAGGKWKILDEDVKKKYEVKYKEMKEKYDEEYKEWLKDGGKKAIKAAKKEAKEGKSSKSPKNSSKSPKKKVTNKEPAWGNGPNFPSKEFISSSSSGSD